MLSGIHSLFFGKKHNKHKQDDSMDDKSQLSNENDFVILERRHSDEYDRNSTLYPNLDPSQSLSNLPYTISPSLPNLKDPSFNSQGTQEEMKVDMLQGVPFVLSSQLLLLEDNNNENLKRIIQDLHNMKELGEESIMKDFKYDFKLEHTVSSET